MAAVDDDDADAGVGRLLADTELHSDPRVRRAVADFEAGENLHRIR